MELRSLPLTLRQLQYVVAVAEEQSFRGAAKRCFVSQPALSAQVAEVERGLGVQLFERDRRRFVITQAGAEVVSRARSVLLAADDLVAAATRHSNPLAGTLRIGVIPTIGPYLLPHLDPALRARFPDLSLQWTEDKTAALVAMVEAGSLDAALLALETDIGSLIHETVGEDRFVFAAAKGERLGSLKRSVRLDELRSADVLLLDDGHCFRDQALEFCTSAGAKERSFRATSLSTLAQMVAAGGSVTLLPEIALRVENRHDQLGIRRFAKPCPKRTVALAWRRQSPLAEALSELASAATGVFAAVRGRGR